MDVDISMEVMEQRLAELSERLKKATGASAVATTDLSGAPTAPDLSVHPAPGIRLLTPTTGWKPCPIGVNGITMRVS